MGSTRCFKSLVACTSSDEAANGRDSTVVHSLCADTDSVRGHRCFHWAVKLKRLRDFSTLQIAKVFLSGLSRELQVCLFLLDRAFVILVFLDLIAADLFGERTHGKG
jgi:hypothetical protein